MIRALKRLCLAALLVFALTFAGVLFTTGRMMERHLDGEGLEGTADAALVLGAGLEPDLELGFSARRRIRVGVHLLATGKVKRLIVSDGSYRWQGVTTARRMKAFALSLGALDEQVIEEDLARTTFDSFRLVRPILADEEIQSVVIVTDAYHLARSEKLADYFGVPVAGLAAAAGLGDERRVTQAHALARETLAWWYNLGKGALWWALAKAGWTETERIRLVR